MAADERVSITADDLFVTIALVHPNDRINAAKYTTIAPNFPVVSTVTGKISVLIVLRLLTLSAKPWQRKIWLPETDGSSILITYPLTAFNAFADWALALFPAILFRKVKLPLLKKVGDIAVLGAGVLDMARHHKMVNMYLIIICASVPTMPQSFNALLHPCRTYHKYNSKSSRCNLSRSNLREPGILLQHMQHSPLFDAPAEHTGSQENILARNEGESNTNTGEMMDLTVAQDSDREEIVLAQGGTS
ncbi:uncharacterized protein BDW70DRAFT_152839 [Aspergillus foveolatus]|uniref:uncharacterized protein n=1 Tax=Aspergillus foveolatus TaxID=210207 RepID=UPI003CCD974B